MGGSPQGRDSICSGKRGFESVLLCCRIAPAQPRPRQKTCAVRPPNPEALSPSRARDRNAMCVALFRLLRDTLPGRFPDSLKVPSLPNLEHRITRSSAGSTRTGEVSCTIVLRRKALKKPPRRRSFAARSGAFRLVGFGGASDRSICFPGSRYPGGIAADPAQPRGRSR